MDKNARARSAIRFEFNRAFRRRRADAQAFRNLLDSMGPLRTGTRHHLVRSVNCLLRPQPATPSATRNWKYAVTRAFLRVQGSIHGDKETPGSRFSHAETKRSESAIGSDARNRRVTEITTVPNAPDTIEGVINLRQKSFP